VSDAEPPRADERRAARDVTLAGAVLDGALGLAKITVGFLAGSQALVADGVHSLSDLATDAGVLVVTVLARREPDAGHPYGHDRFETLGSLVLGAVLLVVAGGLAYDSLLRLLSARFPTPGPAALVVALLSIAGKEWIFRWTRRVAERIGSRLLLANAWHSRSDALSSVAVLLGVSGAMAGFPWLDLVAAIAVAGLVGWVGWRLIAGAAQELVDTGLSPSALADVRLATLDVQGVLGVHQVRSRRMGAAVLLDLDIVVRPEVSVSEGHQIAWTVSRRLRDRFPEVRDVKVHVDPEESGTRGDLPLRAEAERVLLAHWPPELVRRIRRLTLHYGREGLDVDLYFTGEGDAVHPPPREAALRTAAGNPPWLRELRVWSDASAH
jgi:cation diffusion facilitator family transporter